MSKVYLVCSREELYHHGIKGQRWGIRRFQNADGSLKAAGRKRYGVEDTRGDYNTDSKKSDTSKSSDGTESKEYKKAKLARNLAIGAAAVAGAAVLAYGASQYVKNHKDLVIEGGEALQRITTQEEGSNLYDNFYAAVGKHDMDRYKAYMPKFHLNEREGGEHLIKQLEAKSTMKIAAPKNAEKIFNQLRESDPSFKKAFNSWGVTNYEEFNQNIVNYRLDANSQKNFNKFRDAMEKAGYAGVIDVNDRKYSGYAAKNPAVIFRAGAAEIKKLENLPRENLTAERKEIGKATIENLINDKSMVLGAAAITGGFSAKKIAESQYIMENEKRRVKNNSAS